MCRLIAIALILAALSGCSTTLYGLQTSSGASSATTTGSSVRASTQAGNARIGASFGTPPSPNAPSGQIALSSHASAVLAVGLVVAGLAEAFGQWLAAPPVSPQRESPSPGGIAQTCSCYGWRPEWLTPASPPQ
jgi:hypothetical protein